MELREILTYFDVGRRISETSYQCKCPHHTDNKASMTVTEKDGKILIHCHAGCETEDILKDVGLTMEDLIVKPSAAEDFGGEKWRKDLEAVYDYFDDNGNYRYSKLRYKGKRIFNGVITKDKGCDFKSVPKDRYLFNSKRIRENLKEKPREPVYIVEGEKDVITLTGLGLAAATAGGAKQWRKAFAKYFKGAYVVILPDNDEPGRDLAERIVKDIKGTCYAYKVARTSTAEHGDVTDYIEEGHTKEDLMKLVEAEPWTIEGKAKKASFTWANDVKAEPTKWLWYPYYIDENINIFGGETGTGKTWNLCAIVATVTTGNQPEGMPGIVEKQGNVLYLGGEDGNSGIRARLEAVGADLAKVALVENHIDCTGSEFIGLLEEVKPVLVIIDPLMSFVGSDVNINDYVGARQVADHLRTVAREYKTSIIMVVHPPKRGDYKLLYRFTGSGAFVDATRTATYIGYHPTEPRKRVGIQPKNNIKKTAPYTFTLDEELGFIWTGEDSSVKQKDIEAASAYEAESSGTNLEYYKKVIAEVMKINPTGLDATAKEILDEFSKVKGHEISPRSFGQVLNKKMFQQALSRQGITLRVGSRTHGRQKYSLHYTEQIVAP